MDNSGTGREGLAQKGVESAVTGRRFQLEPDEGPVMNPLKGLRDLYKPGREACPGTLSKYYFPWNWLERQAGDGVDRILEVSEESFGDILERGRRVIPRVFLEWPRSEPDYFQKGAYWPSDLEEGSYEGSRFLDRVSRLVAKLGEAWDKDERVGYVEMGIVGHWGEHHHPRIHAELQRVMGEAFAAAFKRTRIMQRYPDDFGDHAFGLHWDSFAHPGEADKEAFLYQTSWADRWKTQVIGGEMGYNWGKMWATRPVEGVLNHTVFLQSRIRDLHVNHLDFWVRASDLEAPSVRHRVDMLNNTLGYHFRVEEAVLPLQIVPGEPFDVELSVSNLGASPFYYPWPFELAFFREETPEEPLCSCLDPHLDIRRWLPASEPLPVKVRGRIPAAVAPGRFRLACAVLDPATDRPGIRFASKGHDRSGRLSLGTVEVVSRP